ncbi:hypothetical protein EXZ60_01685 [Vibrio sp. 1151_11]|nr:hypothetical protein [Vibrio sp. 1151_11]
MRLSSIFAVLLFLAIAITE